MDCLMKSIGTLGHLIGNKFRIAWDMFAGFVKDLDYQDIGALCCRTFNISFRHCFFWKRRCSTKQPYERGF